MDLDGAKKLVDLISRVESGSNINVTMNITESQHVKYIDNLIHFHPEGGIQALTFFKFSEENNKVQSISKR